VRLWVHVAHGVDTDNDGRRQGAGISEYKKLTNFYRVEDPGQQVQVVDVDDLFVPLSIVESAAIRTRRNRRNRAKSAPAETSPLPTIGGGRIAVESAVLIGNKQDTEDVG
jgi:hypothetical protein